MLESTQARLRRIRDELGEIHSLHTDQANFIFGFHYQLHDEEGRLVDAFSLSNIQQSTTIQHYMKQLDNTT